MQDIQINAQNVKNLQINPQCIRLTKMKFKKLVGKFEALVDKYAQGSESKLGKVRKLEQLLADKKASYEAKLADTEVPAKRSKLKTRLKVVAAQLEKAKQLSAKNSTSQ